jgi:protein-disulfide isomerase
MVALAPASPDDDVWWLVDLAARKVVSGSGNCGEDRGWTISAPAGTWEQVIRDGLNLGIAFRRHGMRYRDKGGGGAGSTTADNRVSMMSDLLGVVTWDPRRAGGLAPAPPPARGDRAGEGPADVEQNDHEADDELPPWEPGRRPPPEAADLDAVLWPTAPAEQTPEVARIARISISMAGRAAPITTPGEARAPGPSAELAALSASAPGRERPRARSYSRSTAGKPGRGPTSARERLHLDRTLRARRRRRFRMATVCAIALIAAAITTSVALQQGGGSAVRVNAASSAFGYPGPYAPVTLNADNSVTMAQPGVTQPVLDVYEDFQCSQCRRFEEGSGAAIQRLADEGKVKVVYYPFTVFDSQPQRADSIRAWAAAKCVPANLWARYHNWLYASQPAQTAAGGFAVNLLVRLGKSAGITSPSFAQCVQSQQYAVQDPPLSDQIMNSGVNSMLTLKLNGEVLDPLLSSSQIRQQIISASSARTTAARNAQ